MNDRNAKQAAATAVRNRNHPPDPHADDQHHKTPSPVLRSGSAVPDHRTPKQKAAQALRAFRERR